MSKLLNKIENEFWNITIPLLTESTFVRNSFREVHDIYQNPNSAWILLVLTGAAMALATGFILGRVQLIF